MSVAGSIRLENVFLDVRKDLERVVRRRVHSSDMAADLVQDVYMKCRTVAAEFPSAQEARAYLIRMASNLAIDHQRVEGRRAVILGELKPCLESYDGAAASPEAHAIANDQARQIERVLAELPKLTQQMFTLVRLQGLTHGEAAKQLGVSKSLVDKYMVQALLRCRDVLGGLDKLD